MGLLKRIAGVAALCFVVALAGRSVGADKADDRDSARALADRAWELFQGGKYDEAIAVLEKAEARHHAPTLLLLLARSHDRAGHLLEARAVYEKLVAETLDDRAPQPFRDAQAAARPELAAIRDRIPSLKLDVRGRDRAEVRIEIDGAAAEIAGADGVAVNPGNHRIVASAGSIRIERQVLAREGRQEVVELVFRESTPQTKPTAAPPPIAERPNRGRGPNVPAIVSFGVAGVALGVGSVTGYLALQRASDVKDRCVDSHCPPDAEGDSDRSKRLGNISTVSFVLAGAAAATGIVLVLVRSDDERPVVRARVSPTFVGLERVF